MKIVLTFIPLLIATPAFAHHEVVVATSAIPLVMGIASMTVGAFTAWRLARRRRKAQTRL